MRQLSRRRRAVNAVIVTLLVAATVTATDSVAATPAASSAGAATGDATPLHGVNRIVATHPARVYVALSAPVVLRQKDHGFGLLRGLTIHGAGRIYGLTLTDPQGHRGVVAMHFNPCFTAGCDHWPSSDEPGQLAITWDVTAPFDQQVDGRLRLPAGRYVLSVFTDGAPVQVHWRIPGLDGSGRLRLHTAQNQKLATPDEGAPAAGPVRTESQFSGIGTLQTDIVVLAEAEEVATDAHVTSDSSWCIYDGDPPPGNRPLPECAGGSGVSVGLTYVTLNTRGMGYGLALMAGPGSAGRYFQSIDDSGVQKISDAQANLFWADAGWQTQ